MSATLTSAPPLSAALRSFEAQWRGRSVDELAPVREQAMAAFLALGLPTTRDESWRYTSLRHLATQHYVAAERKSRLEVQPSATLSIVDETERAATVLMINGYPSLAPTGTNLNGIEIHTIREIARHDPTAILRHMDLPGDDDQERFTLLNTALFVDGLYLKITKTVRTPLVILHVGAGDERHMAHPRVIIEALPGTSATIIEHHVAQESATARVPVINSHTRIALSRDAKLEHYRVFATGAGATHLDSVDIRQEENSRCTQFTIVLGGGLVRTALAARLLQRQASLDAYSLLVGHEERHVDCVNVVSHEAPDTRSRQTARAIASDRSRIIFNSKVVVKPGADGTESQQSARGLLLSPTAEIDTRPQLEIHADAVKCNHGATTGRLDPDMLFYLLSRGLNRATAQSVLVYAFLADVLTGMSVGSARSAIENALIAQLPDSQLLRTFK